MVEIKSKEELNKLKTACEVVKEVLEKVAEKVKPGVTTKSLDNYIENIIKSRSAVPSFKGYRGYPASACISINDVVVHGIPSETVLKEGDIVSIDVGAFKNGFHGDACRTFCVGDVDPEKRRLADVTEASFFEGIRFADEQHRLYDISHAIQVYVEKNGFNVIRDYYGHGIGRELHEEPTIPNFGKPNRGIRLRAGMVLAIEPMVVAGDWQVKVLEDGWTVVTIDGKCAAHYENTVAITHNGPEILTL
ncbi:MAG: type I methionyl aminopeptidase [Calditerrivibrio sp.]|nr:type I methionyl aminopeptidase [Calditerrivibrio sp.]